MKTTLANASVAVLCIVAFGLTSALPSVAEEEEVPEFDLATAVGIWLFDEGDGDVANDTSGNGNDGDLMVGPEWVDGRFGKAIQFNGNNQFVWVRNPVNLPVAAEPRTLMCFFKWPEVLWPDNPRDLALGFGGIALMGYGPAAVQQFSQRVCLWLDDHRAIGLETCYDTVLAPWEGDSEWHHLAVVYPSGATKTTDFRVYFDGRLQDTDTEGDSDIETTVGVLTIGCQAGTNTQLFKGMVDDVAVFPHALPDEHIRSIAKHGLVGARAVSPSGKLATSWGILKARSSLHDGVDL